MRACWQWGLVAAALLAPLPAFAQFVVVNATGAKSAEFARKIEERVCAQADCVPAKKVLKGKKVDWKKAGKLNVRFALEVGATKEGKNVFFSLRVLDEKRALSTKMLSASGTAPDEKQLDGLAAGVWKTSGIAPRAPAEPVVVKPEPATTGTGGTGAGAATGGPATGGAATSTATTGGTATGGTAASGTSTGGTAATGGTATGGTSTGGTTGGTAASGTSTGGATTGTATGGAATSSTATGAGVGGTAALDPEGGGSSLEVGRGSSPASSGLTPAESLARYRFAGELSYDMQNRTFEYAGFRSRDLRAYVMPFFPRLSARAELFPFTTSGGHLSRLGLEASGALSPFLSTDMGDGTESVTFHGRGDVGVQYRLALTGTPLVLRARAGLYVQAFTLRTPLARLPNALYAGFRLGVGAELPFAQRFVAFAQAAVLPTFLTQELLSPAYFQRGSNVGVETRAGLSVHVSGPVWVRASFEWTHSFITLDSTVVQDTFAMGAFDRYLGFSLAGRVQFD